MRKLIIAALICIFHSGMSQEKEMRVSIHLGTELRFSPIRLSQAYTMYDIDLTAPEVDFRRQSTGLPLMFDIGLRSHKLKGSLQFTMHLRYDHIAFDSQSPDTLWFNTYTGESINGFIFDYGLYLSKDLFKVKDRPVAIEAGFMWLNNGAKVLYTANFQFAPGYHFQATKIWSAQYVAMSANITLSSDHFKYKLGANLLEGAVMPYRSPNYNYLSVRLSATYKLPLARILKQLD